MNPFSHSWPHTVQLPPLHHIAQVSSETKNQPQPSIYLSGNGTYAYHRAPQSTVSSLLMEQQKPCISCSLLAVVKPGMMSPLVYRCSTQVTQSIEKRAEDWFHEGQSWCSGEMLVGMRWALPTRKRPYVLPHVPLLRGGCVGLVLHGVFQPIWLKVSRRHGPSVGKSATNQPVGISVSSIHARLVVQEAGVGLVLAALALLGCCQHAHVHLCWVLEPCFSLHLQTSYRPAQAIYF